MAPWAGAFGWIYCAHSTYFDFVIDRSAGAAARSKPLRQHGMCVFPIQSMPTLE